MSRIIITYTIFSVLLFGALFAAFFISGLGTPTVEWSETDGTQASLDEAVEPPQTPEPIDLNLDYPALEPGRTYRVSHETRTFLTPDATTREADRVPARGFMTVSSSLDTPEGRWYAITLSDGVQNYPRYILAKDLNFKRLTPLYSPEERETKAHEAALARIREIGERRRAERLAAAPPPPPEPRAPQTFGEWWAMTAERMGGAQSASLVAAGVAATVATALTISSILLIVALRREHTWDRARTHDLDAEWEEATRDDADDEPDVYAGAQVDGTDERW